MSDTDLFDDLKLKKKEKEWKNKLDTSDITEENINNEQNEKTNTPEINTSGNNKNDSDVKLRPKGRKGRRKKSKTSNLGYKIGLFLDILITALLVYLAIKISLLFFISLVVTLPIGIFCAIKLCGCCLGSRATTITSPYNYGNGDVFCGTTEPERVPIRDGISLEDEDMEGNEKGKPVKVIIKTDK